jgi:choline monooxygenase
MNIDGISSDFAPQPLDQATALPARCYVDAEWHDHERHAVFGSHWHLAAHASQLANAGDHLYLDVAGVPLILVRDSQDALHALHNVCRHRAGPLSVCGTAERLRLRCRYHAWTYAPDGRLLTAPEMDAAEGFDPGTVHLPRARVELWRDLVFVALDDRVPPVAEQWHDLDERLGTRTLEGFRFHRQVSYRIACNWKIYVDNYLEGYHIPHIHPELNRILDYRSYATETGHAFSLQHSPLESVPDLYGAGDALYVFLWPNAMLNVLPDRLQINRVLPIAANSCRVEFDYFYPVDAGEPATADRHDRDHRFSDLVQVEDVTICEAVQRGLQSGSYSPGRLNPLRESGVHHFQERLRAAYRIALPDAS